MIHHTFHQGMYFSGFDLQAPRWTQVAPKSCQDSAKKNPKWPKIASNVSNMAPKIYQMAPKWCPENFRGNPKLPTWNNLAPEPPLEAPWVRLFMIVEGFCILPSPILNDFQCLLASLLAFNSSIRLKRQTPETMQTNCKKLLNKRASNTIAEN